MHQLQLTKPDGRRLTLYSRRPIDTGLQAPSPFAEPLHPNPHLRWHPLRGEWVAYAAHRQDRTFLPPPEYNPLAVTSDPEHPTELPAGDWDVAVFDNRFPSLTAAAHDAPLSTVPTAIGNGHCEVVVFTQDPSSSLGRLPVEHLALLIEVWGDRCRHLGQQHDIAYVLPFENRGKEVGVTLHHPHGQIYAYPEVPPVPRRMGEQQAAHLAEHGRGLLETMIEREIADHARRLLYLGELAVAWVPACARYPYEVWVATRRPVARFEQLCDADRLDLARALKTVLLKYDGLWQRPMPYLMAWYSAPSQGDHPGWHLHAQLWPPYRTPDKLKVLAGTELAAGWFAVDALPEDKAAELQAVPVELDR
ncbi:galactose-1-phosphate uridylyltransferase [Aquabacterium sp. J223]|uniref:galactose-1-phosphate uridylyltransferase n=1 Tax=Aquabacterium sp. J223 TaxID=2898431 RepID=UPI0021AD9A0C|nr:galactose-1-phosphate uridylyltransferase [Aquabacterium sp. J223]UUX97542.1 galactose-1-phosphate uridylyltransferase [Aquabacterium sp. J223]